MLHLFNQRKLDGSSFEYNIISSYEESDASEVGFFVWENGTKIQPFNKIITTNSTGILPVQDKERLQVIDCKEIFEEYLKENN